MEETAGHLSNEGVCFACRGAVNDLRDICASLDGGFFIEQNLPYFPSSDMPIDPYCNPPRLVVKQLHYSTVARDMPSIQNLVP